MKKITAMIMSAVLSITLLSGCSVVRSGIAYTIYPIGYLIDRLAGSTVNAYSVQDETQLIQRAALKSDALENLDTAEVFFHIGTLEPYLAVYGKKIEESGCEDQDLSALNAIYQFKRYTQVISDGNVSYIEGPYYRGSEFDLIDTDTLDLCLWNDPIAMLSMSKSIFAWLKKAYPEDAEKFSANLERLETDLINLDAQYQALATSLVTNNQEIRFVSMTASFGNWQKTYGFQVYPVVLSKYGVLPNKDQLDSIKARILADGVKYIVYEPNMTEDMIALFDELESELSLTRVELSNLSSLTKAEEDAGKDYLSVMYENLNVLETMKTPIGGSVETEQEES
ncbi:MAG: zinc ABC transporter substrate-binding protein [Solobacterium sp.]|nr:zinc ABC transporter substrate-binding protein [Solobacterium sp.]